MKAILHRSAQVFTALAKFAAAPDHRLVILPGNHDLELNLPGVRRRLEETLGVTPGAANYAFIENGKPYLPGNDVLIEHGNRVDAMNFADYRAIRRVCELIAAGKAVKPEFQFDPPAGSKLVAQVMNGIKRQYSFIDLLKPEVEAAFPVILALEPGRRGELANIAWMLHQGKARFDRQQNMIFEVAIAGRKPAEEAETPPPSAEAAAKPIRPEDALGDILEKTVGRRDFAKPAPPPPGEAVKEIAIVDKVKSLWSLLTGKRDETWEDRLWDLHTALLAFQGENCFDRGQETLAEYRDEAAKLARAPIRYVAFGHTHLAKQVALDDGAIYFNSGTWADLLELPRAILDSTRQFLPLSDLEAFVQDLVKGDFSKYDTFRPTYIRIAQDANGNSLTADLFDYERGKPVRQ